MFFIDKDIFPARTGDKMEEKVVANGPRMVCHHICFKAGGIEGAHSHSGDQVAYVMNGKFEFNLDGDERLLGKGDSVYIPSGTIHSLVCLEDGETLDVVAQQMEDYS